jgi:hypothetical protein
MASGCTKRGGVKLKGWMKMDWVRKSSSMILVWLRSLLQPLAANGGYRKVNGNNSEVKKKGLMDKVARQSI